MKERFGVEVLDLDSDRGGEEGMEATMKRIAFVQPRCGGCLISRLLALSSFSAFLP